MFFLYNKICLAIKVKLITLLMTVMLYCSIIELTLELNC